MRNIILDLEYLGGALWETDDENISQYLPYETDLRFSDSVKEKIFYLHNEILMSSFDNNYPPDSGFHTIEEVKYSLYYKLYVATLLSQEYTQGKVLLYGDAKEPISIEEYIKYLSKLTNEDLKSWLRPDVR